MRQKKFALYIRPVARNTTPMGHRRGPNSANMLAIAEKSKILGKTEVFERSVAVGVLN